MTEIILLNSVKKKFNINGKEQTVLDLSLSVREKEFVTILGPSGCGKTTLVNVLGGFLKPDEGRISCYGKEVVHPDSSRMVISQEHAVFPWRTVLQNIMLGTESKKITSKKRKLISKRYLQLVGLDGAESMYPCELSGGMKQRVAIARALATESQLLLMDEPFSALDSKMRESLQDELLKIYHKTGKTIIFVTHNISEAVYLGSRVIILKKGENSVIADIKNIVPYTKRSRTNKKLRNIEKKIKKILTTH